MNSTLAKVYGAIAAIPLGAIMLASAIGGGSSSDYDYDDYERDLAKIEQADNAGSGAVVSEADAYESLGKYNPCIFIECEGE
jgi:hypothetical protein